MLFPFMSEIISYMKYEIVKNHSTDMEVQNKKYPSCYHYNVLIMLAKRLIKEEKEKQEKIKNY